MIWNFVDFPAGVIPFGIESGGNIDNYNDEDDALLMLAKEVRMYSLKLCLNYLPNIHSSNNLHP